MFPSIHSDGVQRQICIGDIVVIYGLGSTKFLFDCCSSWYIPGSCLCKAIQKRRHHLTTFTRDTYNFDHRTTLAYRHYWERIYARESFLLSSASSFLAWLDLLEAFSAIRKRFFLLQNEKPCIENTGTEVFFPSSSGAGSSVHS